MNYLQTTGAQFVRTIRPGQADIRRPAGLTAKLANDRKTRTDAFVLRHTSYLSGGYIDPKPNGMFSDSYDDMENCQSLVVYQGSRAIASARVCVLDTDPAVKGWDDIPAARIFPEDVAKLLASTSNTGKPAKALEINRLVRHPDFADDVSLVFVLYRLAGYMIIHHDTDFVLSCVRRNHTPFYKRLKFEQIAGPRVYAGVKFETNLMACPRQSYDAVQTMPIFNAVTASETAYEGLLRGETISVFGGK
jgi:hypothetical protein